MRRMLRLEVVQDDGFEVPPRPKTWGDCKGHEGPCPWVGCEANLYLEVSKDGKSIRYNFPDKEPWEVEFSCSLIEAERGGLTLEELAKRFRLTRERIRQIEVNLKARLAQQLADTGIGPEVLEGTAGAGLAEDISSRLRIARAASNES